ncbi:MAG: DUF4339 domain-containing protein [Kiritimatiellia bacterium]|jgi:hypothetical protein
MRVAWYYSVDGKVSEPLSWDDLRQAATDGKFGAEDFVWSKAFNSEWRKASTIESLFPPPKPDPATTPPPLPPPGDAPVVLHRHGPVAIELVPLASPFAEPEASTDVQPDATAKHDASRLKVKCLRALATGWRQTQHILFSSFSFRRWLLFALCVMFSLLYQHTSPDFLALVSQSSPTLQEIVKSNTLKLREGFAQMMEEDAGAPSQHGAVNRAGDAASLMGEAVRDASIGFVDWFKGPKNHTALAATGMWIFFIIVIGVWFNARGHVMFLTRLYMPDSPLFVSWSESDAAAKTLFRGLFFIRLLFKAAEITLLATMIRALADVPADVPTPNELLLQIFKAALLFWLVKTLLMGYIQDVIVPLIVLENKRFLPAFAAALRISGFWLVRYFAALLLVIAVTTMLIMSASLLFGPTAFITMGLLLPQPFFNALLLLPLHMLRRLWSLNIVFTLRPELRKAVPAVKTIRIVK